MISITRLAAACVLTASIFSSALAQQLELRSRLVSQVIGIEQAEEIGGYLFVDRGSSVGRRDVVIVSADSEAANITFDVTDEDRSPVQYDQISPSAISIAASGKVWIDVVALDFEQNIYSKKMLVIDSGVEPDDEDVHPDVDNEYGVGAVAYKFAPKENREEVASIYASGSDFLYGRPEAKTVQGTLQWIKEQTSEVTGNEWDDWRKKVADALVKSEESRVGGFSREDWYRSFNEIAKGLRAANE
jgi:hypothetical protein